MAAAFLKKPRGFSLIEILIALSILVIFLSALLWLYNQQVLKGRDARRQSDLRIIKVSLEDFYNDNEHYPTTDVLDCSPGTNLQPYLPKVSCDPATGESYYYETQSSATPNWFKIYANLETLSPGGCGPGEGYNYGVSSPNVDTACASLAGRYGCFQGVCRAVQSGDNCPAYYSSPDCNSACNDDRNWCNQ